MSEQQVEEINKFIKEYMPKARCTILMTTDVNGEIAMTLQGNHMDFVYMSKILDMQLSKIIMLSQPKTNDVKPIETVTKTDSPGVPS